MFACPERPHQFLVELAQDVVGHRLEATATGGQGHPEGAPVVDIALAHDQPVLLAELDQPCDRLLGQPRHGGQLAEAQAVPLEERYQHGPVGASDIRKSTIGEPLHE